MPVRYNHGIEHFLPPDIDMPDRVAFSKCQFPFIVPGSRRGRQLGYTLHGCVEHQKRIGFVESEVTLHVLTGNPVWNKGPIRKPGIGKAHRNVWDISPGVGWVSVCVEQSSTVRCI